MEAASIDSGLRRNDGECDYTPWIPACAGMTVYVATRTRVIGLRRADYGGALAGGGVVLEAAGDSDCGQEAEDDTADGRDDAAD